MKNPAPPRSPKAQRSRVANGSTLLVGVDGRSASARRFRELFEHYLAQAPGNEALAKSAASLVLQQEVMAARVVNGEEVDALASVRLAGALDRTLRTLRAVSVTSTAAPVTRLESREAAAS
jgi:hypothetical protein